MSKLIKIILIVLIFFLLLNNYLKKKENYTINKNEKKNIIKCNKNYDNTTTYGDIFNKENLKKIFKNDAFVPKLSNVKFLLAMAFTNQKIIDYLNKGELKLFDDIKEEITNLEEEPDVKEYSIEYVFNKIFQKKLKKEKVDKLNEICSNSKQKVSEKKAAKKAAKKKKNQQMKKFK